MLCLSDFFSKVMDKPDSSVLQSYKIDSLGQKSLTPPIGRRASAALNDSPEKLLLPGSNKAPVGPLLLNVPPDESQLVMDIARLLLSCLHAWGLDPHLDQMAMTKLGLLSPKQPITYGIPSRGNFMCLLLPGWWRRQQAAEAVETAQATAAACVGHWRISCSLTTQHLLAVISVTNTLMRMTNATFLSSAAAKRKSAIMKIGSPR